MTAAQATVAQNAEQLTKLNEQVATAAADNRDLNQRIVNLTNQVSSLSAQLYQTQTNLTQTSQNLALAKTNYAALENRFRRDVAERIVVEHKFNMISELQAQLKKLQTNPGQWATPKSIYEGLNVEVSSNGACHVIAPE